MQQKNQSKLKQIYLKNTSWPKHVHLFLSLSTDIICKFSLIWSLAGAQERLNKSRSQSFKRKRGRVKFWNEKIISALIYFLRKKSPVLFNFYRGILQKKKNNSSICPLRMLHGLRRWGRGRGDGSRVIFIKFWLVPCLVFPLQVSYCGPFSDPLDDSLV